MTCGGICMRDFAEISSKLALAHTERRSALEDIYALRLQEQRTRLRSGNVRLPDVSVFPRDLPIEQVYTRAQLIVIEVLSPEDRQSKVQERIADYIDFGVANIWFVDPKKRIGWDCTSGDWIRKHRFEVEESPIYLSLDELFCQVGANEE
jgi:Uma2 family endonuclease